MAPIRRYLRLTPYTVLEVRIYLDNPADAGRWLLAKHTDPALPRIISAIRPLVLPKLREENDRLKGGKSKGRKKGSVKDVVTGNDFEVSIFLTHLSSRHTILRKEKIINDNEAVVIPDEEEPKVLLADIPTLDGSVEIEAGEAAQTTERPEDKGEDKKKLGFATNYDGFSIYRQILCLVVKRTGTVRGKSAQTGGHVMLEEWIASTQARQDQVV